MNRNAALSSDTLNLLWRVLKQVVFLVGSALAPLITELAQRITRAAIVVSDWIKQNKALIVTAFKVAAAVVAAGFALIAMGLLVSPPPHRRGGGRPRIGARRDRRPALLYICFAQVGLDEPRL